MVKKLKLSDAVKEFGNVNTGPGCPYVTCTFPAYTPCPEPSVCHWEEVEPQAGDFVVGCRDGKLVLFPVVDCEDDAGGEDPPMEYINRSVLQLSPAAKALTVKK